MSHTYEHNNAGFGQSVVGFVITVVVLVKTKLSQCQNENVHVHAIWVVFDITSIVYTGGWNVIFY